jgi:hypothetical protein
MANQITAGLGKTISEGALSIINIIIMRKAH